ncbi:prolyl oligopeptidase family serine peptidase [Erysipelothrix rhusiopathiae]|uniref:alpha/beta hydrolase n=2 Tax=Erysipelothrix rhusiopathiae TaxID=1648 RepID=UPI000210B55D|nr:alpha/beta hydrolase-fold protein [Erysipelothrix rhusiopathiae]AMS10769.1 esterase [Erysipelothrix rhusiopathiae]AOO66959.1 esterase [Erysipelothrix rhusiopathiae]AWU41865.1 esterase [Erysipelothrix rhusiopathiae]MDE8282896.1 alpha/beta hydrolase-fold protein [Erysipelothrix rhusiopathiae]MDV7677787.1 prolyl oligopeptidase family serine peptidase [Erysipelothrix rhusiopathiae]
MGKSGEMVDGTIYSPSLGFDWNYSAYCPYLDSNESFGSLPVVYLLHGATGNHRNMTERFLLPEFLDECMELGECRKCVVIFVDGFNSFYLNSRCFQMETAVIEDLIPTLEARLGLHPTREKRFIGGLSMGGYGASNLALRYPEYFSKVMALSPAVWYTMTPSTVTYEWHVFRDQNDVFDYELWNRQHPSASLASYQSKNLPVSFLVMTGGLDEAVPIADVKQFVADLEAYTEVDVHYLDDGDHSWPFWEYGTYYAFKHFF